MDNFISILRDSNSPEELEELKVQLYRENVRIKTDKADLEELRSSIFSEKRELEDSMAKLEEGRRQFEKEADEINARIEASRKNLEEDINDYNIRKGLLEDAIKKALIIQALCFRDIISQCLHFRALRVTNTHVRRILRYSPVQSE